MARKSLTKGRGILVNKARCRRCGDTLTSTVAEKILYCSCFGIHISGGTKDTLRGGTLEFLDDLAVFK